MKFYHWCLIAFVSLEALALIKGVDGQMFSLAVGGITGLIGFHYGKRKKRKT